MGCGRRCEGAPTVGEPTGDWKVEGLDESKMGFVCGDMFEGVRVWPLAVRRVGTAGMPGVGVVPSRSERTISPALNFAYFIVSST